MDGERIKFREPTQCIWEDCDGKVETSIEQTLNGDVPWEHRQYPRVDVLEEVLSLTVTRPEAFVTGRFDSNQPFVRPEDLGDGG